MAKYFVVTLVTSTILLIGLNQAIKIEINPATYDKVIHDELNITCTPDGDDNAVKKILVIQIMKENQPIVFKSPGVQPSFTNGNQPRFVATGQIRKHKASQSYLRLTLTSYESSDSGLYSCVMYFVDETGLIKMEKSSLNLTEEQQNVKTLENALQFMKTKMAKMEHDFNQKVSRNHQEMTERTTGLENNVNFTTAFSATNKRTSITTTDGKVLILPDVIMRYGEGYDETTGVFTSPRDGLYAFHVVVANSRYGNGIHMDLRKNEEVVARLWAYDRYSWGQSSMSSVVNLKSGDRVFSVMNDNGATLRHDQYTVFTGYLIHPF